MKQESRLSRYRWAIPLLLLLLLMVGFSLSHRGILLERKENASNQIASCLTERYGKKFVVENVNRRIRWFQPAQDRFEAVCSDGDIVFPVYAYEKSGRITDSYGAAAMERQIQDAVTSCAEDLKIRSNLESVTWRAEGLYQSDSDTDSFLNIDPDTPLVAINRIDRIQWVDVSSEEQGLELSQNLLYALKDQKSIFLDSVNFWFVVENAADQEKTKRIVLC